MPTTPFWQNLYALSLLVLKKAPHQTLYTMGKARSTPKARLLFVQENISRDKTHGTPYGKQRTAPFRAPNLLNTSKPYVQQPTLLYHPTEKHKGIYYIWKRKALAPVLLNHKK